MDGSQQGAPQRILSAVERAASGHSRHAEAYRGDEDRPVESFAVLLAVYLTLVVVLGAVVRARGRELPERVTLEDLALVSVATHKVSRLVTKDPVTSPLRAPFARFAGRSADAELTEEVRGTGMRKAIGELVTCPFCVGQWVATALVYGLVLAPRATRLVAATFTALTASDFLHYLYSQAQQAVES
jgi:hypothetical protein